jgi:hypothetical protein
MVSVAHSLGSNPEVLYNREERRRAVRLEISGLPLVEGFVIRHLYGIGCDQLTRRQLARQMRWSLEAIATAELSAMEKLAPALRYLL